MYKIKPKRTITSRILHKSRNRTGYVGVVQWYNDYIAQIKVSGRTHRIGIYATAEAAHKAYLKTAKQLGLKIKVKP